MDTWMGVGGPFRLSGICLNAYSQLFPVIAKQHQSVFSKTHKHQFNHKKMTTGI